MDNFHDVPRPHAAATKQQHFHHRFTRQNIRQMVVDILLTGVIIFLVWQVAQVHPVQGQSMLPGIHSGSWAIASPMDVRIAGVIRGSIVIAHEPNNRSITVIKRVIGMPGDTVDVTVKGIFINRIPLTEPYATTAFNPIGEHWVLGKDAYFLLGDNRSVSCDSRMFGPVARSDIIGRVMLIWQPWTHWVSEPSITTAHIPISRQIPAQTQAPVNFHAGTCH